VVTRIEGGRIVERWVRPDALGLIGSVVIRLRCSTDRSSNHRETVTTDPMMRQLGVVELPIE
jgi:hypothetical protein